MILDTDTLSMTPSFLIERNNYSTLLHALLFEVVSFSSGGGFSCMARKPLLMAYAKALFCCSLDKLLIMVYALRHI
jgi:hypothetical protein